MDTKKKISEIYEKGLKKLANCIKGNIQMKNFVDLWGETFFILKKIKEKK